MPENGEVSAQAVLDAIICAPDSLGKYRDALAMLAALKERDRIVESAYNRAVREAAKRYVAKLATSGRYSDADAAMGLVESMLELDAACDFDAYMQFMEWGRPPKKRFYQPRRAVLIPVAMDLQDLFDGRIELYSLSLPPRTGKSTIGCMFMSFSIGNNPEDAHLMTGFSDKLTSSFWYEMLGLITDSDTYRFARVFPDAAFVDKNAANETIHLVKRGRFPALTCRSIGGTLTGAVEVGKHGILYCDDMVEDYEQALSADRMDKLYDAYLSQARDRKLDGAREFHIGTRWVPNDIIGRLEVEFEGDSRMRARRIPALDENGESNFDYQFGLGFSTEYYEEMRRMLCNAGAEDNWSAKYMCSPYWKEGRLYETDDLRFFEELPEGEPDIVMAVCDTKTKGPDYCVQVVDAVYGDDHYIIEVVCDDGLMESIEPRLADQLAACNVSMARYESNVAGGKIARDVEGMCIARGLPIVMKTKYSTENKETRILADSGWVKRKCLFRSAETRDSEYERFMSQLLSYNVKTKNKHDDVPDAMSMLRRFCDSSLKAKAVAMKRPF